MDYRYIVLLIAMVLVVLTVLEISSENHKETTTDSMEPINETVPETEPMTTCESTEEPTETEPEEDIVLPVETEAPTEEMVKPDLEDTMSELKEAVQEAVDEVVESAPTMYYDVPLDHDLQDYIFELCDVYQVDPAIIIAMIEKESNYRVDTIGDNGASKGLMQIQSRWHQARMDNLGVTNLLDPYQNVLVGIDFFAELMVDGHDSLVWALMAYNGGPSYATDMRSTGTISYYARRVMQIADGLKRVAVYKN